jgi:hypothetical protein
MHGMKIPVTLSLLHHCVLQLPSLKAKIIELFGNLTRDQHIQKVRELVDMVSGIPISSTSSRESVNLESSISSVMLCAISYRFKFGPDKKFVQIVRDLLKTDKFKNSDNELYLCGNRGIAQPEYWLTYSPELFALIVSSKSVQINSYIFICKPI